ncbi:MAG: hypothetical protein LBV42_02355 [Methanobrevibacter sp.]|jgi:hypothetical protein|nr:hypothetical protein [Methanobrevibacter sp.]
MSVLLEVMETDLIVYFFQHPTESIEIMFKIMTLTINYLIPKTNKSIDYLR